MKYLAVCALLAQPLAPQSAAAQDFDTGFAAYQAGDYETALAEWLPLAQEGDAFAQFNLGFMYDEGLGVPQDDAKAVEWYRLAAEQGDARAQTNLGFMYREGEGVPQDDARAVEWYRLAAEQGDAASILAARGCLLLHLPPYSPDPCVAENSPPDCFLHVPHPSKWPSPSSRPTSDASAQRPSRPSSPPSATSAPSSHPTNASTTSPMQDTSQIESKTL